jgi:triacylglycerol lipase
MHRVRHILFLLCCLLVPAFAHATCVDNVVFVHGNTGSPSDFQATHDLLIQRGYTEAQIFAPAWGNGLCAACNDHSASELAPVETAMTAAIAASCSHKIDVIGHSMGATLAAKAIVDLNVSSSVDAFIGIAGAFHGLYACGYYPFNVATVTCGSKGLSIASPLLTSLATKHFGAREYSFISYVDEINCYYSCLVYGVHTSTITGETGSYTFAYDHYGLLYLTATQQAALL